MDGDDKIMDNLQKIKCILNITCCSKCGPQRVTPRTNLFTPILHSNRCFPPFPFPI